MEGAHRGHSCVSTADLDILFLKILSNVQDLKKQMLSDMHTTNYEKECAQQIITMCAR